MYECYKVKNAIGGEVIGEVDNTARGDYIRWKANLPTSKLDHDGTVRDAITLFAHGWVDHNCVYRSICAARVKMK